MKIRPRMNYPRLSTEKEYDVYSIAVWQSGKIRFCMILDAIGDNAEFVSWSSPSEFILTETSISADWECHLFSHESVHMLIGPSFISESPESYIRLVEHEHKKIAEFWEYVNKLRDS